MVRVPRPGTVACSGAGPDVPQPVAPQPVPVGASTAAPRADGPPIAKKDRHVEKLHGVDRVDDYYWLRKKGDPEVEAYLGAENAFTAKMTDGSKPFQDKLYGELLARVKETDETPPVKDGAWLYYSRTEQGKQYPIYCRKKASGGPEVVMIDLNEIAKTQKFVDVRGLNVSDDGNLLVYRIDTQGFRQYVMKTKDLRTGKDGSEATERVDAANFAADGKTIFYVTEDAQTKRPNKLFRHVLGAPSADDVLVYEEKDEMFDLSSYKTRSRAFFVVQSASRTTSETRVLDAEEAARAAAPHRPARARPRVLRRSPRRPLLHPHELGRPELPARDRARRRSAPREMEGGRRARPRRHARGLRRLQRPRGAPRAQGCAARGRRRRPPVEIAADARAARADL